MQNPERQGTRPTGGVRPEYFNIQDLSRYLGIKPSTSYSLVEERSIPHYRIGKLIRFKRAEIDAWMEGNKKDYIAPENAARKALGPVQKHKIEIDRVVSSEKRLKGQEDRGILNLTGNRTKSRASEGRFLMGLFKRGSVWWMSFTYQGKQIKKSTETDDKKLAQRIYDKVKGEIAERKWFEKLPGEDKTFAELMERYMAEHSARNKTHKSHNRDRSLLDHLLQSFADLTIVEITPNLISGYKTKRRVEKAAPQTINNEISLMSHAFNLAVKEWEWIKENPVKKVSKEKVNNQIERWLTFEEQKSLLDKSPKWLQEIILFAVNTGLRQGEILNLKWSQADLSRKTITILEQKNQGKDTLPLNEKALEVLNERKRVHYDGVGYVFCTRKATRIGARNLLRAFYSATEKSGIENLRFHDLRHTFATRLVQAGVDIYTVQKLGRWKTISMVMRYAHHYPESLRSGVEVLDRIEKKVSTKLAQSKEKGVTASV